MVTPALAIQADFSGEYYVQGNYNDNLSLREDEGSSDAFMEMRLRLKAVFEINKHVSLTTRLDALDKRWGDTDESKATSRSTMNSGTVSLAYPQVTTATSVEDDDNIDFEWAYLTIKTGLGGFLVGRQRGNVWGINFAETEYARDRVTYVLPIQNTIIAAVYEKSREFDGEDLTQNDADMDRYYLTATQKGEKFKAGMLYGFYNFKTFQDMWQLRQTALLQAASSANGSNPAFDTGFLRSEAAAHVFIPYFDGKFGPLGIKAEVTYANGEVKYDGAWRRTPTDAEFIASGLNPALLAAGVANEDGEDSKDGELLAYNLELNYDVGAFTFTAGYAHFSGDADYEDDTIKSFGFLETGEDWEKLAILTGTNQGLDKNLGGGLGNLAGGGKACLDGFRMFYLGASYAIRDNLSVGLLYAKSQADDVTEYDASRANIIYPAINANFGAGYNNADWDDDHGQEVDLTLTWQIFDNLKYQFIAAYLDTGDYWKQGDDDAKLDDTYLFWHRLMVEF